MPPEIIYDTNTAGGEADSNARRQLRRVRRELEACSAECKTLEKDVARLVAANNRLVAEFKAYKEMKRDA